MQENKRGRKPIPSSDRKSETVRALVTPIIATIIRTTAKDSSLTESDVLRLSLLELLFPVFNDIIDDPTFDNVRDIFISRHPTR